MKAVMIVMDLLAFLFAAHFLVYRVKAGIIERHILADFQGRYETGRAAVVRGILYIVIGCYFLGGAVFLAANLWVRS